MRLRVVLALFLVLWIAACGGGSKPAQVVQTPVPTPTPTPTPTPSGLQDPVPVIVADADVGGIDINVAAPAANPSINAELLGISDLGEPGTATSTGATVRRGEIKRVIIFGRGLNGTLRVTIEGPQDIAVSNIHTIRSTNDDPGVAFDISVAGGAALGARSVVLRAPNDDVAVFTGGLEVLP